MQKNEIILNRRRLIYLASLSEFYLKILKMIRKNNIINLNKKFAKNLKEKKVINIQKAYYVYIKKIFTSINFQSKEFFNKYNWRGTIRIRKNKINNLIQNTLNFNRFFIWKKKSYFLYRFRWFYRNSIILKKYYTKFYNFKNSWKLHKRYVSCLARSNNKTYNLLQVLNFRIDLLLVRTLFVRDTWTVKSLILLKKIFINGILLNTLNVWKAQLKYSFNIVNYNMITLILFKFLTTKIKCQCWIILKLKRRIKSNKLIWTISWIILNYLIFNILEKDYRITYFKLFYSIINKLILIIKYKFNMKKKKNYSKIKNDVIWFNTLNSDKIYWKLGNVNLYINLRQNLCNFYWKKKKRKDKKWLQKYFILKSKNYIIEYLRFIKRKIKCLNNDYLKKKSWPSTDFKLYSKIKIITQIFKKLTSNLKIQIKNIKILYKILKKFYFSFLFRIYIIDNFYLNKIKVLSKQIKSVKFNLYFKLLKLTHPKIYKINFLIIIKSIKIRKNINSKRQILKIKNLIDTIFQLQFFELINSFMDSNICNSVFGFRKGKNLLQVIISVIKNIYSNNLSCSWFFFININQLFKNISIDFVVKYFPFPKKHLFLLKRWINQLRINNISKFKKIREYKIFNNLIINFIIHKLLHGILSCKQILNKFKLNYTDNFWISYFNHIVLKISNKSIMKSFIKIITKRFILIGLNLNYDKIKYFNLKNISQFSLLGYNFFIWLNNLKSLNKKCKLNKIILSITSKKLKNIKKSLKENIRLLSIKPLYIILNQLNFKIRNLIRYYYFENNVNILSYLTHFIDRLSWRHLIKKYRFKGLRRPKWIAKQFFINNESPVSREWHLHAKIKHFNKDSKIIWMLYPFYLYKKINIMKICSSVKLKKYSWYLKKKRVFKFKFMIFKFKEYLRYKYKFLTFYLNKIQKGICIYCHEPIWNYKSIININFKKLWQYYLLFYKINILTKSVYYYLSHKKCFQYFYNII